jgi:formate dehydrogenase subunit delta
VSGDKIAKLVRMANQIGDFYAAMPEAEAAESAEKHLRLYWTPKMIRELIAFGESGGSALNPTAHSAVALLKRDASSRVHAQKEGLVEGEE